MNIFDTLRSGLRRSYFVIEFFHSNQELFFNFKHNTQTKLEGLQHLRARKFRVGLSFVRLPRPPKTQILIKFATKRQTTS